MSSFDDDLVVNYINIIVLKRAGNVFGFIVILEKQATKDVQNYMFFNDPAQFKQTNMMNMKQ